MLGGGSVGVNVSDYSRCSVDTLNDLGPIELQVSTTVYNHYSYNWHVAPVIADNHRVPLTRYQQRDYNDSAMSG